MPVKDTFGTVTVFPTALLGMLRAGRPLTVAAVDVAGHVADPPAVPALSHVLPAVSP